jgi:hypothetical protein
MIAPFCNNFAWGGVKKTMKGNKYRSFTYSEPVFYSEYVN